MPEPVLKAESTLTDRYQTTIPESVRKALNLQKRERLRYEINTDGTVTVSKSEEENDPLLNKFLDFLANDIEQHPENLKPLTNSYMEQINALVENMDVDLNEQLDSEDEE